MNTTIKERSIKVVLLAAVLLAAGLLAQPANAQTGIRGKFTLPFETHWGKAVLPPGDYELKFVNGNVGPMVAIRDAKSLRTVAFESINIREDNAEGTSALLIGSRGTQHVVYALKIGELGETFVYERPPARAVEEARKTQAVPVVVAKK